MGLPYTFTVTALYANGKRSESIALTVKSGENVSTEDEEMKPTTPPAGEGKPDGEGKPESDGKPDGEGKPEGEGEENLHLQKQLTGHSQIQMPSC